MWERVVRRSDDPQCRCFKITLAEMLLSFQLLETNTKNITTKNDEISVVWDTDDNLKRVQDTIQWYTKFFRAKVVVLQTGVAANVKLTQGRKTGGYCGPGCKCQNWPNIPNVQHQSLVFGRTLRIGGL